MNVRLVLGMLCLLSLGSGCATTSGAPKRPYSDDYVKAVSADAQLRGLLVNDIGKGRRKELVFQALAAIDIHYNDFKQKLSSQKQHSSAVVDGLTLAMTVAGALTDSAGVQKNYLQGIALVTGASTIYDKNYLQSQTISALVAQMDANRETVRNEIVRGLGKSVKEYPGMAAHNDILRYYQAGTVIGAVLGIQSDARGKEAEKKDDTTNVLLPKML